MHKPIEYWKQKVGRDLVSFFCIITIASTVGLICNQMVDDSLPMVYQPKEQRIEQAVASVDAAPLKSMSLPFTAGVKFTQVHDDVITLQEIQTFIAHKRGIVVDARPQVFYEVGHIPGAVSLPRDDFESSYKSLRKMLEADKSRPLAVYCSTQSCADSALVQRGLILLGYTTVYRFSGGWLAWTKANLPIEQANIHLGNTHSQ